MMRGLHGSSESVGEPLSALDTVFLYLESPRTPMHAGSVAIFESAPLTDRRGRLRIDAIRREVERRLYRVPKLRRRVAFGLLGEVSPRWVDDPNFDVSRHVRQVALPTPGTEAQLTEVCAELLAVPLEREHPLWEMWFIEGLEGGRVALLQKLHHAVADGLAGVELATVLLDLQRHVAPTPIPPRPWYPRPAPAETRALVSDLAALAAVPLHAARIGLSAARHPLRSARSTARTLDALGTLVTPRTIAPRCSLNQQIGQGRRVELVRESIEDLTRVERRFGVTMNDVLLTAVAGGLRELFDARGESDAPPSVHVLVPVGTEHGGDRRLGNRVSAMMPRLPVTRSGAVTRLRSVAREMARCKRHHQPLAGELLLQVLGPLPQPALATVTRMVNHQPLVNLVVTNVPGTSFPLYARGAQMLEVFPFVPLAGNLSIGVAALSYDGQLAIGLNADRDLCSDLGVFAHGITRTFAELVSAAEKGRRRTAAAPERARPRQPSAGALAKPAARVGGGRS